MKGIRRLAGFAIPGLLTFSSASLCPAAAISTRVARLTTKTVAPSSWKTFVWKAEGLSFRYPSTWKLNNPLVPRSAQPPDGPSSPLLLLMDQRASEARGTSPGNLGLQKYQGSFALWAEKGPPGQIKSDDVASEGATVLATDPLHLPGLGAMTALEEDGWGSPPGAVTVLALTSSVVQRGTSLP
ncbi:MAG TPA: hypothetical protein VFN61_06935 [Acidimicrobiales bacterium]|nr:hypothetical protein [Acidimicrobiales bacterium]